MLSCFTFSMDSAFALTPLGYPIGLSHPPNVVPADRANVGLWDSAPLEQAVFRVRPGKILNRRARGGW